MRTLNTDKKKKKLGRKRLIFLALILILICTLSYNYYFKWIIGKINGKFVFLDRNYNISYKKSIHKFDYPEFFYFSLIDGDGVCSYKNKYIFINENSEIDTLNYNPELHKLGIGNILINYDTLNLNFLNIPDNLKKGDSLYYLMEKLIVKFEFGNSQGLLINHLNNSKTDFIYKNLKKSYFKNIEKIVDFERLIINLKGVLIYIPNHYFYFYEINDNFIGSTKRIVFDIK